MENQDHVSKLSALIPITAHDIPSATGKVVYITGGGSGIGLASAKLFAERGAKGVVIADFRKPAAEVLEYLPQNILFVHTDVSSWPSMVASFDTTIANFGTLDYVFANAGLGELEHLFEDHFDADGKLQGMKYTAIEVNLKGVLNTVKLAVHWFRKLKVAGHIVMTSSMSGYETPGIPIYVSSKHGVVGILRAASRDLYDHFGICLNSIAPGPVLTRLIDSFAPRSSTGQTASATEEKPYEFENQEPIYPAIAAAHLLSHDTYGQAILVHAGRYREIEGIYASIREDMLGGALGLPPVSDPGWRNLFACSF